MFMREIILKICNEIQNSKTVEENKILNANYKDERISFEHEKNRLEFILEKQNKNQIRKEEKISRLEKQMEITLKLKKEAIEAKHLRKQNSLLEHRKCLTEQQLSETQKNLEAQIKSREHLTKELCEKERKLKLLSQSLGDNKEKAAKKISKRFREEQKRVDQIIRLHEEETTEFEEAIRDRDLDIKSLYDKIREQDETIQKMGRSLLTLSRKPKDSDLKKSFEASQVEVLKLKSKIANLSELKEGRPDNIHTALQKGFRLEKEYKLLRDRAERQTRELEESVALISAQKSKLSKAEKSFLLFKEDSSHRTDFYREITHSILRKYREALEAQGGTERAAGLEEMYRLIARCEDNQLATPRLKRVMGRFEDCK